MSDRDEARQSEIGGGSLLLSEAELWAIYSKGDKVFFRPVEKFLALPPPDKSGRLSGPPQDEKDAGVGERRQTDASVMSTAVGLLIASRPQAFPHSTKIAVGQTFNPTELTAEFVSRYLINIRKIVCGAPISGSDKPRVTRAMVGSVAQCLAVGVVAIESTLMAFAALVLITMLKATKMTLCEMTTDDVIRALVDPSRAIRKTSEGASETPPVKSTRPRSLALTIGVIVLGLVLLLVLKSRV